MTDQPQNHDRALADELLSNAQFAKNVQRLALEATAAQLAAGTHKDPSTAARNAAVVVGISLEKRELLLDKPLPPRTHADPKIAAQALARRLGVAIEVPDRQRTLTQQAGSAPANAPAREP